MKTEKTYTQSQVKDIVDWYEAENKKLKDFKRQITWIIDRHVSYNTSDENMLKEIEKMAIQRMLEDDEKAQQEAYDIDSNIVGADWDSEQDYGVLRPRS